MIPRLLKRVVRRFTDRRYPPGALLHERYQVKKRIGVGSYGNVYLCSDRQSGRDCVVKQMTKSKAKREVYPMYRKEAEILRQLNHPRIPSFFGAFTCQKDRFIAMEFIDGRNLEDVLFYGEQIFSEKDSLILLNELADIAAYLHSRGIAHGDIRIPNVLLKDGAPHLIDFGLAGELNTERQQEDFFDLGDLLLFLLYSGYSGRTKKDRSWTEELTLHPQTEHLLKRLLSIGRPYSGIDEVLRDIRKAVLALGA